MTKYRISKYSPKYRNERGEYARNDWTSYADIGKEYDAEQLTAEKYLNIEQRYGDIVQAICLENDVGELVVEELECNFSIEELKELLNAKGIDLSDRDTRLINNIKNGSTVSQVSLKDIISLILRDCFWCRLVTEDHEFVIEFGYDLYIYITCCTMTCRIIQQADALGVYIESM